MLTLKSHPYAAHTSLTFRTAFRSSPHLFKGNKRVCGQTAFAFEKPCFVLVLSTGIPVTAFVLNNLREPSPRADLDIEAKQEVNLQSRGLAE